VSDLGARDGERAGVYLPSLEQSRPAMAVPINVGLPGMSGHQIAKGCGCF